MSLSDISALPLPPFSSSLTPSLPHLPFQLAGELMDIKQKSRTFTMLKQIETQTTFEEDRALRDLFPSVQLSTSIVDNSDLYALVGATFELPLINKKAKATHETAKLSKQKTTLEVTVETEKLLTTLRNIHAALTTQKILINIATKKQQLAHSILKEESENYSFGKITLNDYIVAVNRYDTARFDAIDRKITYQQLSVEWKRLTDRLITKSLDAL